MGYLIKQEWGQRLNAIVHNPLMFPPRRMRLESLLTSILCASNCPVLSPVMTVKSSLALEGLVALWTYKLVCPRPMSQMQLLAS